MKSFRAQFTTVSALTFGLYVLLFIFFGIFQERNSRISREIVNWLYVVPALAFYIWGGYLLWHHGDSKSSYDSWARKWIYLSAGAFILLCFFTPPFHSTDLTGYINRGWQQVAYHVNPYTSVVADITNWRDDPLLSNHWIENPCPYGFLFAWITKPVMMLGHVLNPKSWWISALLFKGLNVICIALCTWFLWRGVKALNVPKPTLMLYAFLWNPLLLVHGVINAHNDILMATFTLGGIVLSLLGAGWILIPALISATFIKYAAGVTLPIGMIWLWRAYGWRTACISLVLGIAWFGTFSWEYIQPLLQHGWAGFPWDKMQENATVVHNAIGSIPLYFYKLYSRGHDTLVATRPMAKQIVKLLFYGGFGLWCLWEYSKTMFGSMLSNRQWVARMVMLQFGLVAVASLKFYPWYLHMFFPMIFLLDWEDSVKQLVLLLSLTQLLALTFVGQAHLVNVLVMLVIPWITFAIIRRFGVGKAKRQVRGLR